MAWDERMAARIREVLASRNDVTERKMFGGLCFMVSGNMCCGLTSEAFMVRVGKEQFEGALAQPHARVMDFTGRPSSGMIYVEAEGLKTRAALTKWVQRGLDYAGSLPPKKKVKAVRKPGPRRG